MDAKERSLLGDIHNRLVAGNFGEVDVLALLAVLRDHVSVQGPVRELGHFVAHRERDRGPMHSYLLEMRDIFERIYARNYSGVIGPHEIFSSDDIARALDSALTEQGLETLSQLRHRQGQLAILSMIHCAAVVDRDGRQEIGSLELAIMRDKIELRGSVTISAPCGSVKFPALSVTNDGFYPMVGQNSSLTPPGIIKVVVRDGIVHLEGMKPYEIYIGRKRLRGAQVAPAPLTWAEVEAALSGANVAVIRWDASEVDIPAGDETHVTFRFVDGRLRWYGREQHFRRESLVWRFALLLKQRLNAHVYDDVGGYRFETPETLSLLEPE